VLAFIEAKLLVFVKRSLVIDNVLSGRAMLYCSHNYVQINIISLPLVVQPVLFWNGWISLWALSCNHRFIC